MPLSSDQHIIDQQFRDQLNSYSVKPSSRVWWRIARSINLQRGKGTRKIILFTAGLLLIGSSAGLYETLHHSKKASKSQSKVVEMKPEAKQTSALLAYNSEPVTSKSEHQIGGNCIHHYPQAKSDNSIPISSEVANNEIVSDQSLVRETETVASLLSCDLGQLSQSIQYPPYVNSPGIDQPGKLGVGSYYIGITATVNNTWLIDKQAVSSDNLKYQFTFGAAYGMQGGYYFAKRWGIQTAWILNSWQGQKYKNIDLYGRTTNLDYTQKSISLTYMSVPLLVQYRVPKYSDFLKNAYNINLVFGGQYGHLIGYRIDGVKGEINNNHIFNRNEFAAVAGIDYDFMTENTVFYSLGIRTSLSTSVFNSNVPNYFEFSKPHNFLIGVRGAVNFGFTK